MSFPEYSHTPEKVPEKALLYREGPGTLPGNRPKTSPLYCRAAPTLPTPTRLGFKQAFSRQQGEEEQAEWESKGKDQVSTKGPEWLTVSQRGHPPCFLVRRGLSRPAKPPGLNVSPGAERESSLVGRLPSSQNTPPGRGML